MDVSKGKYIKKSVVQLPEHQSPDVQGPATSGIMLVLHMLSIRDVCRYRKCPFVHFDSSL